MAQSCDSEDCDGWDGWAPVCVAKTRGDGCRPAGAEPRGVPAGWGSLMEGGGGCGPGAGAGEARGELGEGDEAAAVGVEVAEVRLQHRKRRRQLLPERARRADSRSLRLRLRPQARSVLAVESRAGQAAGDSVKKKHEARKGDAIPILI